MSGVPFELIVKKKIPLSQIFFTLAPLLMLWTNIRYESIDAIDVTSVTPSRLNSINAIGVTGC